MEFTYHWEDAALSGLADVGARLLEVREVVRVASG